MVVAALQVLATHPSRPVAPLLRVLGHHEPAVREAALAAMPPQLAAADVRLLLERLEQGGESAFTALQVLARAEWTEEIERALWQRFAGLDDELQITILDACIDKRRAPAEVRAVWDVAFGDGSLEVRTRALRCLELAGAHDREGLQEAVAALPNGLRYHGARCLLRNGDLRGVELLIQIVDQSGAVTEEQRADEPQLPDQETEDQPAGDQQAEQQLAAKQDAEELLAAKHLLVHVTNVPVHRGVAAWRRWLDAGPSLPAKVRLPAAPF